MSTNRNHNIARLATKEANIVYKTREKKRNHGDLISNPGRIKPFGQYDEFQAKGKPITVDVIKNDYDANNDILDLELFDTVSVRGGKIAISKKRGPGGRKLLTYTPPQNFNGRDYFHYIVADSSGLIDWGAGP